MAEPNVSEARLRAADASQPRWLRPAMLALLALLVLLHIAEVISLHGKMGSDYNVFYDGARQFVTDPMALYPHDAKRTLLGYLYPPPSVFLFLPLLLGSLETSFLWANAVVLGCGIGACAAWLWLVRRDHGLAEDRLAALIVLGLAMATGAMLAVRQGQVDTIILALCVAPVLLDAKGSPRTAGAIIAVGCWIKIYPVLMLFWLIGRPRWRSLGLGFAVAAVGVPVVSLLVIPVDLYTDYFINQLPSMSGHAIVNIDNQSLAGILTRTAAPMELYTTSYSTLPLPQWFRAGIVIAMLGGMGAITWRVRTTGAPTLTVASWAMALACLVAPLGWGHTYCLLLPLFIETARVAFARRAWAECLVIAGCYAALLLPAHHRLFFGEALPAALAQLFYARYAIAALVLLAVSWRQCGAVRPSPLAVAA